MKHKRKFNIEQKINHGHGQESIIIEVLTNTIAIMHSKTKTITWMFIPDVWSWIDHRMWLLLEENEYMI